MKVKVAKVNYTKFLVAETDVGDIYCSIPTEWARKVSATSEARDRKLLRDAKIQAKQKQFQLTKERQKKEIE